VDPPPIPNDLRRFRRRWVFGALGVFALAFPFTLGPRLIEWQVKRAWDHDCPSCRLEIGRVFFWPFSREVSFYNLRLVAGRPETLGVEATIQSLSAHVAANKLMRGHFYISEIRIESPNVVIRDGDTPTPAKTPESSASPPSDSGPPTEFVIESMIVRNGSFRYERTIHGHTARLHVHRIAGGVGPVGSTPALRAQPISGEVSCVLEKSGESKLRVTYFPFAEKLKADVDLAVKGQNLGDLAFFERNDGIALKGRLVEGKSHVSVRDRLLQGWVYAKYDGFGVEFDPQRDRSENQAFFMNLGAKLMMDPDNRDEARPDQTKAIEAERRPGEALVGFILRGMKEAALDVVTSPRLLSPKEKARAFLRKRGP
jgi:hypothetical protein